MPALPGDAPPEFGTGALPSPEDPDDIWLPEAAAAGAAGAGSSLSRFILGNRPGILNQGLTSQCVAYATENEQLWQDRVDTGKWYNFDEPLFFHRIGGIEGVGAFARAALDELVGRGYPEAGDTERAWLHKARLYTRVAPSVQAVKDAIVACGGVTAVGPWYSNWTNGIPPSGVLPAPSGGSSGHMVWYPGWDENGIIGQNSWGTLWADGGLFRMSWWVFINRMSEIWTTLDEAKSAQLFNRGRITALDVGIRYETRTLAASELRPGQRWAKTRPAGIRRLSDNKIVASPWDRWFRFGGFRLGPRHGIGKRPNTWARLYIYGAWRVVPAPRVKVDWK